MGTTPTPKRARHKMPAEVKERLERARLTDAYAGRPPYQRNDYLGWIARAKRDDTREKRIEQMLEELRAGAVYMGMAWKRGAAKPRSTGKEGSAAVDAYIASQSVIARRSLEEMRALVKSVAKNAEERISYGMPAFYQGGPIVFYAAFKAHLGLYPLPSGVKAFEAEIEAYQRTKGAIRFPLGEKLPVALIKRIVKFRLAEAEAKR